MYTAAQTTCRGVANYVEAEEAVAFSLFSALINDYSWLDAGRASVRAIREAHRYSHIPVGGKSESVLVHVHY